MITFETASNFYRMVFEVSENEIETHIDRFDSVDEILIPETRRIITPELLVQMGCADTTQFVVKMYQRDRTFRDITGAYADQIKRTYQENINSYRTN
jgi:hypothetical protein